MEKKNVLLAKLVLRWKKNKITSAFKNLSNQCTPYGQGRNQEFKLRGAGDKKKKIQIVRDRTPSPFYDIGPNSRE